MVRTSWVWYFMNKKSYETEKKNVKCDLCDKKFLAKK